MEEETWVILMTLIVLLPSSDGLALRTTTGGTRATHLRLMTKSDESEAAPRRGPAIRENEIAAIFRGVAYGAPTQERPNVTSIAIVAAETFTTSRPLAISSTESTEQIMHGRFFTSPAPISLDRYNEKQSDPSDRNSFLAKDVHESYRVDLDSKINGDMPGSIVSDILGVSTNYPFATSHTAYEISNSEGNVKDGDDITESRNKGVYVSGFPNSINVRWSLGIAWWVHVYVSVGLFTLLALVSLCLMARVAITTRLLPRPHYLALHILIFCASFVRSLHILHESHGMKNLLPITILMAIEEFGWPCLTAALAVLLVAVLREWRYPKHPHLALFLYLFTGLHLVALPSVHLSVVWLSQESIPIRVIIRAVATGWGGAIGIGGMWSVWNESRDYSSRLTDVQVNNNQGNHPNLTHPARLVLTAALTQLLLAGLHLYMLLVPVSPQSHAWIWWSCVTVSRGLELIVGSTLLTAAALTLARQNPCNVFGSCCQKRTVEIVHPAEIKMIHPMGVYTLQPTRPKNEHAQTIAALSLSNSYKEKRDCSSLDYVTSDFQLVWNHSRQRPLGASQTAQHIADDSVLQVCTDKAFSDLQNAHILPLKPRVGVGPFMSSNNFSTLPRNRMYMSPQSCLPLQDDLKSSQEGGVNYASKSSTLLSGSSGSSKLYSSPQIPLRSSRSWDEISTSHIYEDLTKVKPGSVDEALSDLSDLNSDNMNDLFYSEAGSPVLIRPAGKQEKRNYAACYIRANYFKQHSVPPMSTVPSVDRDSKRIQNSTQASQQSSAQHSTSRQNSTQILATRQVLADYCPDKIPPSSKSHIIPDLPLTAHNSSTQQVAIHTSSTRTTTGNHIHSGTSKSRAN